MLLKRDITRSQVRHIWLLLIPLFFLFGCGQSEYHAADVAYSTGNYQAAFGLFSSLAKQGNIEAQYRIGLMYEQGKGVPQDHRKAAMEYLLAAQKGEAKSQVKIAHFYTKGLGLQRDYWEAIKWLREAALQGNAEAEANLGYMFYSGIGITKDYSEAIEWFQKAAKKNWPSAQHNLGIMYQQGHGTKQDYALAVKWYRKAIQHGFLLSQRNLIDIYEKRLGVVPSDDVAAANWYLEAARAKDIVAQYQLGSLYLTGRGLRQDDIKSYAWLGVAAAGGVVVAQKKRDVIARQLKPVQLADARNLARHLWAQYGSEGGSYDTQ